MSAHTKENLAETIAILLKKLAKSMYWPKDGFYFQETLKQKQAKPGFADWRNALKYLL